MKNDLLLRTLRKEKTERVPVWFMRQAGRYLPDYIKLREKYSFFERVRNPQHAAEITVMPVRQVGVDAAILFSDILVIAQALGVGVEILEGKGSKDFEKAKQFCYQHPALAAAMLDKITEASIIYLNMQIKAGVDTVQIF